MTKICSRATIPAQQGWYTATFVEGKSGEYEDHLTHDPVIAWDIERWEREPDNSLGPDMNDSPYVRHLVKPVRVSGNMDSVSNIWAIKRPDGKYEIPDEITLADEAAALAHMREETDWWRKQMAERKAALAAASDL
jgi:hypothetical protein